MSELRAFHLKAQGGRRVRQLAVVGRKDQALNGCISQDNRSCEVHRIERPHNCRHWACGGSDNLRCHRNPANRLSHFIEFGDGAGLSVSGEVPHPAKSIQSPGGLDNRDFGSDGEVPYCPSFQHRPVAEQLPQDAAGIKKVDHDHPGLRAGRSGRLCPMRVESAQCGHRACALWLAETQGRSFQCPRADHRAKASPAARPRFRSLLAPQRGHDQAPRAGSLPTPQPSASSWADSTTMGGTR